MRFLPYTAEHALHLFGLPLRQILAQAIAENIPIVTADQKFRLYKGLELVW